MVECHLDAVIILRPNESFSILTCSPAMKIQEKKYHSGNISIENQFYGVDAYELPLYALQ